MALHVPCAVCKTEQQKFPPYNGHGQAKHRGQVRANLPVQHKPKRGVLTASSAKEGGSHRPGPGVFRPCFQPELLNQ